ncbi:MAG: adenylate kinase [Planctomycetota bacterium]|nr:MAG: adenylate kinase [Planctomycetota bacterium]
MAVIVVLLGPPGAGKGTQAAAAAAARTGWTHLSTGDLLREEVAAGSEVGRRAACYMERGDLVPDEIMVEMVSRRCQNLDPGGLLLLDGFPRTLPQAEALAGPATGRAVRLAVYFTAPDEVLVRRLLGRGRADDDEATVRHRLAVYHETTEPLVGFYQRQDLLRRIDADRDIPVIQTEFLEILDSVVADHRS